MLGYYLIELDEAKPIERNPPKYLINWKSKLDISNANISLITRYDNVTKKPCRQLVITYKSIYINTFNVIVLNLETELILFRHESYHLWEASIGCIMLSNQNLIINCKEGLKIMALGDVHKAIFISPNGIDNMLHSLESCNDLKLEKSNHILL